MLILSLKDQPHVPLEAEVLSPDRLAGLSNDAIRALPAHLGKRKWESLNGAHHYLLRARECVGELCTLASTFAGDGGDHAFQLMILAEVAHGAFAGDGFDAAHAG